MNLEMKVNEILKTAETEGITSALHKQYGKMLKLSIPFSAKACSSGIEVLNLSCRALNSMRRAGIVTIAEAIEAAASGELVRIRNLGKKTENEIKTRLLEYGYENLTLPEKVKFIYSVVALNQKV